MPISKPKRLLGLADRLADRLTPRLAPLGFALALSTSLGCAGSLNRAQESLAVGDEAQAEVHLRKAINQSATQEEASRLLSVMLAKRGESVAASEPRPAENLFTEALELDPSNEQARLGLARLLMKRGFMADARELLASKDCRNCGRLIAIMLHDQAVNALAAGEVATAQAAFQEAFDVGGDPLDALGLAGTHLAGTPPDLDKVQALLEAAAPLIARGQAEAENEFRQLRTKFLLAAAASRQDERVELGFAIRTEELREEPEFDLRFKVANEQFRNGDSDPAIARLRSLLENSSQYLEDTQREIMGAALVTMYSARAAQFLQAGDPAGAARDIADARKIDGDNNRLKLQQILAIAGNGRVQLAFDTLQNDAIPGKDRDQVKAILYTLLAHEQLAAGSIPRAAAHIADANTLAGDLPEVHLAQAYLLTESRNTDLKTKDIQDARKTAAFSYPGGRINQYPGALAHLDRGRKRIAEQGALHPFRGPDFDRRAAELEQKLGEFYPYAVEWFAGDGAVIELFAEAGQKEVEYTGPRWLKGTAIASPGRSAEIPVPNVGLVYLTIDGKQVGVVAEQNAHIKLKL